MKQLKDLKMVQLHDLVKELSVTETFQANEIKENRKQLITKIKKVQELRCLASIRSGYFLKLNPSNVEMTSQLPFINSTNFHISERIVEMAGVSTIRSKVGRLIKEILNERDELPAFFAQLDFNTEHFLPETRSYLPDGITFREFFACCTVPALFGFSFTREFQESFLNFLFQVAEKLPESTFQSFSEHWLFDCLRYYIHSMNVGEFIKCSIGEIILRFIRDKELLKLARKKSYSAIAAKVERFMPTMIANLIDNVQLIPTHIRFILKKISNIQTNPNKRFFTLEMLFLDCILIPALTNLNAYDVLPSSFHFDNSPNGPQIILQVMTTLFRFVLHPERLKIDYPEFDSKSIAAGKMKQLLTTFYDCDGYCLTGPKIVELLPVLELHCMFLIFSLPDIFLLTEVSRHPNAPQSLQNSAKDIPTNVNVPFDFFRHEIWEFKAYDIKKPSIPDDAPKKLTDPIEIIGDALFKFLSFAQIDSESPNNIDRFLVYYEKQMILQRNYLTEAYIRNLNCVYRQVTNSEESEKVLLPALEAELDRHQQKTVDDKITLREINRQIRIVDCIINECNKLSSEALPFLSSNLLSLFINSNPQFTIDLILKKEDMLLNPSAFFDFMQEKLVILKEFIVPIAEYALDEVARHFHTFVMQNLSFNEFKAFKRTYQQSDKQYLSNAENILNQICVSQAPHNLITLFSTKELFDFIIDVVRKAMLLEIPLETVREIAKSFELIKKMKEVETELKITHDELTLVFNFVLLSSNIPSLYSMGKYVQQYLVNIPLGEVVFLTEAENDALKIFCYQITQLDQLLLDF